VHSRRHELQPVAPRVLGEEPCRVLDLVVVEGRDANSIQPRLERLDRGLVVQPERRMGLLGRPEVLLDADVDLLSAALEPEPTSDEEGGVRRSGESAR
jgi:hypothetical protein